MVSVVDKFIKELSGRLEEKNVDISLTPGARRCLARRGYDPLNGARPLSRLIENEIGDRISREILFGELEKGGVVKIACRADKLSFEFKN
jgi:ATP-dependent Clp protease ATP-binding subunit ClpA